MKEALGDEAVAAAKKGFASQKKKFGLNKIKNKIRIMSGSQGIAAGAINSNIDIYIAYPMTPSTGVLHELAGKQVKNKFHD